MKRLLTATALILAAVYLVFVAPSPFFVTAAALLGWLCYHEYAGLVEAHGILRPGVIGILAGLLIIFLPQFALAELLLSAVLTFVLAFRQDDLRQILPSTSCLLLGSLYSFAPWRFAVDLRHVSVNLLFFALALNWVGDSAAYYVGRQIGRHKLAPIVSPGKSREGAAASIAGSTIFGLLYLGHFMPSVPMWKVCLMSILGNVAGQFGDLAESALKRGAGVKDSGRGLPGHGGVLDRMDSSLFSLPVVYVLFTVNFFSLHLPT